MGTPEVAQRAEQATPPLAHHAEGPVWWPDGSGLRWVDMLAGDILSMDAVGRVQRRNVGTVAAALRPRRTGGFVVGVERGFALVDEAGELHTLPEVWSDSSVRMNEGCCDPQGRFYCGSMAYDKSTGRGTVYRLDADTSVTEVFRGVTISNGLAWTADGTLAYYNDTPTQRVDVFSYDPDRGLHERRTLVQIPQEQGAPDGLTVDADGHVWVALYGGSAVHRYRPDGVLDGVVEVPVSQVTACTLGGLRMDELYITTSAEDNAPEPDAGSVFRSSVGVTGLPASTFAG